MRFAHAWVMLPALVFAAGVATAQGKVADGSYACQAWLGSSYVSFGKVRVAGGKLTPNPVAKAGGTVTGIAPSKTGMTINYMTKRGYRESLDCTRG